MFQRMFPTLAKLEPEKRLALAVVTVFAFVAIAGTAESYFIERGWIHEEAR